MNAAIKFLCRLRAFGISCCISLTLLTQFVLKYDFLLHMARPSVLNMEHSYAEVTGQKAELRTAHD